MNRPQKIGRGVLKDPDTNKPGWQRSYVLQSGHAIDGYNLAVDEMDTWLEEVASFNSLLKKIKESDMFMPGIDGTCADDLAKALNKLLSR
jgi:hypothetical protein